MKDRPGEGTPGAQPRNKTISLDSGSQSDRLDGRAHNRGVAFGRPKDPTRLFRATASPEASALNALLARPERALPRSPEAEYDFVFIFLGVEPLAANSWNVPT